MNTIQTLAEEPVDAFEAAAAAEAREAAAAQHLIDEEAEVKEWKKRYDDARKFDANARKQYAIDRSYVGGIAGRGGFDVRVNIAGTYVDILTAFLFARDPETDVTPAESCGPSRLEMARQLSKTLELVIGRMWKNGRLKAAARPMVRSGLSIAIGWFKATWQERSGNDPVIATKISDLQDNLARLDASQTELASGESDDPEALRASIESQIEGLQANIEVVFARGLAIDFVAGEDIQVATEVASLESYRDAPWIAHRSFPTLADAKAMLPALVDKLDKATAYYQIKPSDPLEEAETAATAQSVTADDADSYRSGTGGTLVNSTEGPACVCIIEFWDKQANVIRTMVDGVPCWAKKPYAPRHATKRFYSFFQWSPLTVDGRRHPESLPSRSVELLDEYNRVRSNYREHRRRAIPKLGFNKRAVDVDQAKRMEAGGTGEMIGLDIMGEDAKSVLFPIQYNAIDAALYDTAVIRAELELVWGIQEALSSSIRTAKTLGEAEIQQSGTEARQSYKRDSLEEMFTDFAQYSAEIALQEYSHEDVVKIAGPEAFWPASDGEKLRVEDLDTLVNVEIRAGSSGKPNTRARQEQWGALMPVLKEAIQYVAELRQSNPLDIANCIEQLVIETLERTGERIDPARFLPQPGQPKVLIDPATGQPILAFPAPMAEGGQPPGLPGAIAPPPAAGPPASNDSAQPPQE